MAVVKNLNTDFIISNKLNPDANITLATNTVFVQGNLVVGGNASTVSKTDLAITDNIITLNKGEIGSGVTLGTAGLEIDRGISANVRLVYNETFQKWTITNDGITYGNISFSTGVGVISVIQDSAPQLGGPLDTLNQPIFSSNVDYVKFDDNIALATTSVAPTTLTANTVVYAQTPGLGQSGLYTTTTTYTNQELITKSKAVWYSLIM
jgi:hypothetical protein